MSEEEESEFNWDNPDFSSNWADDDDWDVNDNTNRTLTALMSPPSDSSGDEIIYIASRFINDWQTLEVIDEEEDEAVFEEECARAQPIEEEGNRPQEEVVESKEKDSQAGYSEVHSGDEHDPFPNLGNDKDLQAENQDTQSSETETMVKAKQRSLSCDEQTRENLSFLRALGISANPSWHHANQHPVPNSVPLQFATSLPDTFDPHRFGQSASKKDH